MAVLHRLTVFDNDSDLYVLSVGIGYDGSCLRSQCGMLSVILSFIGS